MEIIREYKGKASRNRAIIKNEFGLLDIDLVNYNLGHKPGIQSAINKTEYFQNQLDKIYNSKIKVLEDYIDTKQNILINDEIGNCRLLVKNLLKGVIPNIRSSIDKTTYFKILSNKIHNNRYDYSTSIYISTKSKISIKCPIHGLFYQATASHLKGCGCPLCGFETISSKRLTYTKGIKNAIVYCLELKEDNGTIFYKIGFTRHSIKYRYCERWKSKSTRKRMPYEYKIMFEKVYSFKEAIKMENKLHKHFSNYHYTPIKKFDGSSRECFSQIINYHEII